MKTQLTKAVWGGLIVLCVSLLAAPMASSQVLNGDSVTLDLLQNELAKQGLGGSQQSGYETSPESETIYPIDKSEQLRNEPLSPIEKSVVARAGVELRQFGYEEFGYASPVVSRISGSLQDSYILGPGDEIIVDLRGQENQSYRVRVGRSGRITLPNLAPISAAGRRFSEFRADLENRVEESLIATQAFVSIGSVRQVNVMVTGGVNAPGTITLSALNSVADALLIAGGVKRSGTLRDIRIVRGNEVLRHDLYGFLTGVDVPVDSRLADGDRIIVRPVGNTVAITGPVGLPGIYELAPGQTTISLATLVDWAGGYLNPGAHRVSALRVRGDGRENFVGLGKTRSATIRAGDVVFIEPAANVASGRILLEGVVSLPGMYDLARHPTLRSLIGTQEKYNEKSYMLFGAISRRDPQTFFRTLVPFSPIQVIQGKFDLALQNDDIIRVFDLAEVQQLTQELKSEREQRDLFRRRAAANIQTTTNGLADDVLQNGVQQTGQGMQGSNNLQTDQSAAGVPGNMAGAGAQSALVPPGAGIGAPAATTATDQTTNEPLYRITPTGQFELIPQTYNAETGEVQAPIELQIEEAQTRRPSLGFDLEDPAIRNLIGNYSVEMIGAVHVPGLYLIMPGTTLDLLVAASGGVSITADLTAIEITSTEIDLTIGQSQTSRANFMVAPQELASINIKPRDVVRFREVYSDRDKGQVSITGQLRYPGQFDILRGEKLSSVLARAGGLTDVAYPYGAIFTRVSAALAEEEGYQRAADELERQFNVLVAEQNIGREGITFVRDTINELKTAQGLGRISVEADPVVLAGNPTKDIILEPGDQLYIPRRPNSVSVTGEVLSAGSYQFDSGRRAKHYVGLAGGYGPAADKRRAFLLLPDGTARRLSGGVASLRSTPIVPGSTIIVPRNLRPFRFRQFALDLSQITSQLAVSAASIAVITDNN